MGPVNTNNSLTPLPYHKRQDISIHVFSNLFSGFFKVALKALLVTINLGTDAFKGMSPRSTWGHLVLCLSAHCSKEAAPGPVLSDMKDPD